MRKIFSAIGGILVYLACLWVGFSELIVRYTGVHTTGTVVALDRGGTKHAEWSFPVETYPDGSKGYAHASQHIWLFLPEIGETGTVVYDPRDPQHKVVFGDFPGPVELLSLAGIPFGLLLLVGMIGQAREPKTTPPIV